MIVSERQMVILIFILISEINVPARKSASDFRELAANSIFLGMH